MGIVLPATQEEELPVDGRALCPGQDGPFLVEKLPFGSWALTPERTSALHRSKLKPVGFLKRRLSLLSWEVRREEI